MRHKFVLITEREGWRSPEEIFRVTCISQDSLATTPAKVSSVATGLSVIPTRMEELYAASVCPKVSKVAASVRIVPLKDVQIRCCGCDRVVVVKEGARYCDNCRSSSVRGRRFMDSAGVSEDQFLEEGSYNDKSNCEEY